MNPFIRSFSNALCMISVIGLTLSASARAETIECHQRNEDRKRGSLWDNITNEDFSLGIREKYKMTCLSYRDPANPESVDVKYSAWGATAKWVGFREFSIDCPFTKKIEGTLRGMDSELGIIGGVGAGLFVGKQGPCTLKGINVLSLAASVMGSSFEVSRSPNPAAQAAAHTKNTPTQSSETSPKKDNEVASSAHE